MLLAVLRFYAERFFSLSALLQQLAVPHPDQLARPMEDTGREQFKKLLGHIRQDCEAVGLRISIKQVERLLQTIEIQSTTVGVIANLIADLRNRINDEMEDSLFVQIPSAKAMFFDTPNLAESLGQSLTDAAFDLDEAGKCIALSRHTAAVFHLMRVVEVSLTRLAGKLGIALSSDQSWGPLIAELDRAIKAITGSEKEAYALALTHLISVKNAWRNPTMHVGRFYDDGQTIAIYISVRFFLDSVRPLIEPPPVTQPLP